MAAFSCWKKKTYHFGVHCAVRTAGPATLAAVGGIIGLILAYGIVALVRAVTPIPVKTPLSAVIISLTVSTAVGLFFGIYTAMHAAKLDPIEALRADG